MDLKLTILYKDGFFNYNIIAITMRNILTIKICCKIFDSQLFVDKFRKKN